MSLAILGNTASAKPLQQPEAPAAVAMNDARVAVLGRYGVKDSSIPPGRILRLGYPGAGFAVSVRGGALGLQLNSSSETNALTVVVDRGEPKLLVLAKGEQVVPLLSEPPVDGDSVHLVQVYKRSETWQGLIDLEALRPGAGTALLEAPRLPARKLLFVGDSVTCGAGVARDAQCTNNPAKPNEDPYNAFDMLLGRRLDAQADLVCYGGRGLQRDYLGHTSKDGILNAPEFLDLAVAADAPAARQTWAAASWVPDAIVVQLGTNDFNLQKTKPLDGDAFVKDYARLLLRLRAEYPKALIVATEGPIVADPPLRAYVRQAVQAAGDARIVWTASKHYPGNGCDGHPTLEQHRHMADDLEPFLREELGW